MEVNLITRSTHPRTTTLEQIRDQQCAGVIVLLPDYYIDEHRILGDSELPVMFLDAQIAIEGAGFIDNDSYSGSCAATRHLLELGHRKIGFLRYHLSSLNQIQRFKGYENTLKEAGIQPTPTWVAESPAPDRRIVRGIDGLRAMKHLLEQAPDITAVLAVDDEMALGAMTHLHKSGKKNPCGHLDHRFRQLSGNRGLVSRTYHRQSSYPACGLPCLESHQGRDRQSRKVEPAAGNSPHASRRPGIYRPRSSVNCRKKHSGFLDTRQI